MKVSRSCNTGELKTLALRLVGAAVLVTVMNACASSGNSFAMLVRDPLVTGCPPGSLLTCEVIGGNKFQKRYGRCVCAAR